MYICELEKKSSKMTIYWPGKPNIDHLYPAPFTRMWCCILRKSFWNLPLRVPNLQKYSEMSTGYCSLGWNLSYRNANGRLLRSGTIFLTEKISLEEMRVQLVKERDDLLAQGQQRQAKEEDWDKRTETLAKVRFGSALFYYLL